MLSRRVLGLLLLLTQLVASFTNDDVDAALACHATVANPISSLKPGAFATNAFFSCFRNESETIAFMDAMAARVTKNVVTKFEVATSYLGRPIFGYKLSPPGASNHAMYVQGLLHAREWVSSMAVVYHLAVLLDAILNKQSNTPYTWYIVPIVNVDGFLTTWTTHERYRRKNMRPVPTDFPSIPNQAEAGVDLNRNWGPLDKFNLDNVTRIDLTYPGTAPFSEPEVLGLHKWFQAHAEIVGYLDMHSYAGMVLTPYGDSNETLPAPYASRYDALGKTIQAAVANASGTSYDAKPEWYLYLSYGTFQDYIFRTYQKAAITFELHGDDFIVPASTIAMRCREAHAALTAFAGNVPAFYDGLGLPITSTTTSLATQPRLSPLLLAGACLLFSLGVAR
ncbi:hypothetical protein SPRG_01458 [Saprolegnia parasitica CBS 223.65]|uniref:Peptidase M14 domain-containing protein n=1 Tax=Saprolegnia parasitica (strain CBS 223.65) TaxID=695850 RepID=A0A067CUZ5_SAPPC|nr:hypothetical protein SPRG_01458 [Saprolegnia parasitica CBS 223.65]KDO34323.1 hypothetical protein SPRG_01458 [Saprolegnia parasitica CBS 223.65]|eukprot:XP_012195060.1 hypothetical protein SPRG_01458 [Saprolegnia parasitica CBS 223.65]